MPNARNVKKVDSSRASGQAQSGYNKGTIREDIRYLEVSEDVRRHRLISIDYVTTLPCHGRGRGFESRRPRHSLQKSCTNFDETNLFSSIRAVFNVERWTSHNHAVGFEHP